MAFLQRKLKTYYIVDKSSGKPKWVKVGDVSFADAKTVLNRYNSDATYLRLDLPGSVTFSEAVEDYLAWAKDNKGARTVETENDVLRKIEKKLGKQKLGSIALAEMEALYRGYSANYQRLIIAALRELFKFGINRNYIKKNPALELKRPSLPVLPPRHVDPDVLRLILSHMSPRVKPKFQIMFYTGMRPSEVMRLQVKDIDLKKGTIMVRFSKTKRFRMIPMHKALVPVFESLVGKKAGEAYLFQSASGGHLVSFKEGLKDACKVAKVNVTAYVFRHTFATEFLRKTGNLRGLQQILGHTTIQMTTRYATVLEPQLHEGIQMLD